IEPGSSAPQSSSKHTQSTHEDKEDKECTTYFKSLTNDQGDHMAIKHFAIEGLPEFHVILLVPDLSRPSFDNFEIKKKCNNIKLYICHDLITDNCEGLIPEWLDFIKGIINSKNLSPYIFHEMLQQDKILKIICKNLVKKCLEMFAKIAEDKENFKKFYKAFSKNIKLRINEDSQNHAKLADLLWYHSTKSYEMTSLKEYVTHMPEKQKNIYYITGKSHTIENSPFIKVLEKKSFEVLLMVNPINEHTITQLKEYDGKKLISITKEGLELKEDEDEKEA
ncbi:Hsp90 chaperone hsp82, partial [Podila verticillata]